RIEDKRWLGIQGCTNVKRSLPLQTAVLQIEIAGAFTPGNAGLRIIPELRNALLKMLAHWKSSQLAIGNLILGSNPIGSFFGIQILHPAVWIRHLCAVIILDNIDCFRRWIRYLPFRFLLVTATHQKQYQYGCTT